MKNHAPISIILSLFIVSLEDQSLYYFSSTLTTLFIRLLFLLVYFKIFKERFFISASANKTDQVWPVPLTYTTGSNPNWENLKPSVVMINRSMEILKEPKQEWVIFNVQQKGRSNYFLNFRHTEMSFSNYFLIPHL